jgi:hypothetical protein
MHGRRHTSTEEERLARKRRQQRKDSSASRDRKRRKVTLFKVELRNKLVDGINKDLDIEPDPSDPEPDGDYTEVEWRNWFGRRVLAGLIELAVTKKK